jgi:hypothetical protein
MALLLLLLELPFPLLKNELFSFRERTVAVADGGDVVRSYLLQFSLMLLSEICCFAAPYPRSAAAF